MGGEKFFRRVVANSVIAVVVLGIFLLAFAPRAIEAATRAGSGAISRGSPDIGGIALMFNVTDGGEYVTAALDILNRRGAKATFFVGGAWAERNEQLLITIYKGGHGVGNHGFFGRDLRRQNARQVREELLAASNLIERVLGEPPSIFAPPLGSFDRGLVETAASVGLSTIIWTHDTEDLRDQDARLIANRATSRLRAGDFVLMHPTAATVAALEDILDRVAERGLRAVTVGELI